MIGNGVWIGANVFIGPGINIGDNSIIGANSVVVKDVLPNSIVGGVPAKLIRMKK
jgi:maltose O-acetyltransferase